MKVNVVRNCSDPNKYYATSCGGRFSIITFEWTGLSWFFHTREAVGQHGGFGAGMTISGEQFPLDYFKKVCQAVWFLQAKDVEFPEIELTKTAMRLLKVR